MDNLWISLFLAVLAGITIPIGAHVASIERIKPQWLEDELRHAIIAFGGGVLLAAVSLVLVPEGIRDLSPFWVVLAFALGGLVVFALDLLLARLGSPSSQLMAMLLDFVPEAIAMGAALATGKPAGLLLALLIALQNFPEGFNAFREAQAHGTTPPKKLLAGFWGLVLLGPLCAYIGFSILAGNPQLIGAIMLFASGGIVYLTFQDIAPQSVLDRHWAPALGAVAGFLVGLIGSLLIL